MLAVFSPTRCGSGSSQCRKVVHENSRSGGGPKKFEGPCAFDDLPHRGERYLTPEVHRSLTTHHTHHLTARPQLLTLPFQRRRPPNTRQIVHGGYRTRSRRWRRRGRFLRTLAHFISTQIFRQYGHALTMIVK